MFCFTGNSHLPFVQGLGLSELRLQHDNRKIVTILPKAIFKKSGKAKPANVPWPPPGEPDLKSV